MLSRLENVVTFLLLPSYATAIWSFILIWAWCWLPPVVIRTDRLHMNAIGLAFLNFIFIHTRCGSSDSEQYQYVYRHEVEHLRQMRCYSPWGCAIFLGGWYFWRCIVKQQRFLSAWRDNPLELMANQISPSDHENNSGR